MANNEQETRRLKIINFCAVFGHILNIFARHGGHLKEEGNGRFDYLWKIDCNITLHMMNFIHSIHKNHLVTNERLVSNILTNKMSPYHFSPNPGSKQWQICTGCFCLEARDQMPSPVFDFNPIWNFSRNINFNLFIIERLSHKNGPVDLNWTSINFRPIKDQVSQIVFFYKKAFNILRKISSLSREIVRLTERMLSMKMFDNRHDVTVKDHATSQPSDWPHSWQYWPLIGHYSDNCR